MLPEIARSQQSLRVAGFLYNLSYNFMHLEKSHGLNNHPLELTCYRNKSRRCGFAYEGLFPGLPYGLRGVKLPWAMGWYVEIIDSAAFLGVGSGVLRPWGKQNGMNEPGGLAIKFRKPEDVVSLNHHLPSAGVGSTLLTGFQVSLQPLLTA